MIEVDLEYPDELHDFHNDYPLGPESLEKNKVWKLISNLNDKEHYILHKRNLELFLELFIHRGIKLREEAWMRSYIEKNTVLRMNAKKKKKFEKDFFKLLNNSVFRETMENVQKRVDIRLVNDREKNQKNDFSSELQASQTFQRKLCGNSSSENETFIRQTDLCGNVNPGSFQDPDV